MSDHLLDEHIEM